MADEQNAERGIGDGKSAYAGWPEDVRKDAGTTSVRRRGKKKRRDFSGPGALSINSLMDIVTIILVYLIKSYATSPIEVKDPAIQLPISNSQEVVEEAAVVMITGPITRQMINNNAVEVKNSPMIVVDGKPVLKLDTNYRVAAADKEGNFIIKPLRDALKSVRDAQELTASITEKGGFTGKVVIIADKETPYRVLSDVLVTCGKAKFGEFKFAVVKSET